MKTFVFLLAIIALASSRGIVFPVELPWAPFDPLDTETNVELSKYLGKWYEIAVFPFYWEKDCHCTRANYSLKADGSIKVLNSCKYKSAAANYSIQEGTAWADEPSKLVVEFFYPFDARYWILKIDPNYKWVLIGEPSRSYLWILSREPTLDKKIYQQLVLYAKLQGFPVEKLQVTDQSCGADE